MNKRETNLVNLSRVALGELAQKMAKNGSPTTVVQLAFTSFVEQLSNEERKELAKALEAGQLPRNLFFNYETQEWIE